VVEPPRQVGPDRRLWADDDGLGRGVGVHRQRPDGHLLALKNEGLGLTATTMPETLKGLIRQVRMEAKAAIPARNELLKDEQPEARQAARDALETIRKEK